MDNTGNTQNKILVEFIHKNVRKHMGRTITIRREIVGVLYAGGAQEGGSYHIGWSKTNTLLGDKFDKNIGIKMAIGRSKANIQKILPDSIPLSIRRNVKRFEKRCQRYYKQQKLDSVIHVNPIATKIATKTGITDINVLNVLRVMA